VRRLRPGDAVVLFDGRGTGFAGRVMEIDREAVKIHVGERLPDRSGESPLAVDLAVAVLKAERIEWVIEKSTELGVSRIRPFSCERSLARPSPARQARWSRVAASAAKQCGRTVVPAVEKAVGFEQLLTSISAELRLLFAENEAGKGLPIRRLPPSSVAIAIGPEGGWTPAELEAAGGAGFETAGLGPRILRAETAAIAAVALCQARWGDVAPDERR